MRLRVSFVVAGLALSVAGASAQGNAGSAARARAKEPRMLARSYQGRGPEQTERFSHKVTIGRDGRVTISNIAGDVTVTGGSGEDVSIEAIKRTRGERDELARVQITVENRSGRVDVRTDHSGSRDRVSVDYTVTVPSSASVELTSISGNLKITGVKGSVRATTISGGVTTTDTPRVESVKSTSGSISINGISSDGDVNAGTISGSVTIKSVKARSLELGTVSGDLIVMDGACERLTAKSISGAIEYTGSLARSGRYDINAHSGTVRLTLPSDVGFDLNATTFSGSIRSDFPMTVGGGSSPDIRRRGMSNHAIHATVGDGSATLTLRTFSGSIIITKR